MAENEKGKTMKTTYKCRTCGKVDVTVKPGSCFGNYAIYRNGRKHCIDCAHKSELKAAIKTGQFTAYLVEDTTTSGRIVSFPGLEFAKVHGIRRSWHNMAGRNGRRDVWFRMAGRTWHGVNIGDNQVVRCKVVKD
jgi:hypothetical protein